MNLFAYWTVVTVRDDNERTACEICSIHSLSTSSVLKAFVHYFSHRLFHPADEMASIVMKGEGLPPERLKEAPY